MTTSGGEIDRIIAAGRKAARLMNCRFKLDPEKIARFPGGRAWLASPAGREALRHAD